MEKSLNLSLLFYPSRATKSVIYSIDIINDSLIIKTNWRAGNKEHRGKLTDEQYSEIEKMISALTQKYDRTGFYAYDVWGCTLEIDNQVYYEDNHFDLIPRSKENYPPPIPEEIKLLINYIVSLSPIPIVLFGFA
ncbi:MAG: hypothetical protein LBH25_14825 [Fibromonadaceae bacterium]|nr:hypothetical protein [Fibromonadaceae bacterium]